MIVQVLVLFETIDEEAYASMQRLARVLTSDPDSVRVAPGQKPDWLAVEFTMPATAQYRVVDRIDAAIRFYAGQRLDSVFCFPKTEAEQARARRKAERRRQRRKKS